MKSIDRREFLQDSALMTAAAGLALAGSSSRAEAGEGDAPDTKKYGPNDTIRLAVLGVRGRGMEHISGFSKVPGVKITTICDPDQKVIGRAQKGVEQRFGSAPRYVQDLRKVFDDPDIDAVSIATPNHWHALATIWAIQAGKDVYVEKPVSHNVSEGRRMVEFARKHNKIVQTGTQCRSNKGMQDAIALLRSGKLGAIYMAKGLCYKWRPSIGHEPDAPVPDGLDYNVWVGPADMKPYNKNRLHYNWHWFWNTGNGDIGNQGIHQMDIARWGLGKTELPKTVTASGGRYGYKDDGETPNTLISAFEYDDCMLEFEVRGLPTNDEDKAEVGVIFYGTEGVLVVTSYTSWHSYFVKQSGRGKREPGPSGNGGGDHFANFIDAVRSRDHKKLNADIEEGHLSSACCHLANISYRLGRKLHINPSAESFVGDSEADSMLTREYRAPFIVPAKA